MNAILSEWKKRQFRFWQTVIGRVGGLYQRRKVNIEYRSFLLAFYATFRQGLLKGWEEGWEIGEGFGNELLCMFSIFTCAWLLYLLEGFSFEGFYEPARHQKQQNVSQFHVKSINIWGLYKLPLILQLFSPSLSSSYFYTLGA